MNQIFAGVLLGILGAGVIAFLITALLLVRKLANEISLMRTELHDGVTALREGLVVIRPLKETVEDGITEFADRMAEATKELRGVARVGSTLESHTDQCKELATIGKEFIKQAHALTALLGAVYGILVRPGMQVPPEVVEIPPAKGKEPPAPTTTAPVDTPPPPPAEAGADFSSFHAFSDEDAAVHEAEQKAKAMGVPITEEPEHPVPKEQMNDGGNV